MGSSSRSASTQATENNSTTFGIQGANNGLILNGSGNTVTDGGAFKIVGDMVDALPMFFSQGAGMVSDGFNAVTDVAMMGERQTESALNAGVDMFYAGTDLQRELSRQSGGFLNDTLSVGRGIFQDGADLLYQLTENQDASSSRAFNAATDVAMIGERQTEQAFNASGDFLDSTLSIGRGVFQDGADLLYNLSGNQDAANGRAFNAVTDVALSSERQSEYLLNAAGNLFGDVSNSQNEMMRLGASVLTETGDILQNSQANAFDFGSNAMSNVSETADSAIHANSLVTSDAIKSNSDLTAIVAGALQNANNSNADLAGLSMSNSAALAESLTRTTLDAGNNANESAMGQLQRGFDSMMGFAEQYSRSDGAALAENNNKTMLYMLGGTALVAGAVILAGRK